MTRYRLKLEASEERTTLRVDLQDLGFTEDEWVKMNPEEQMNEFRKYAENLPEQPYWFVRNVEKLDITNTDNPTK